MITKVPSSKKVFSKKEAKAAVQKLKAVTAPVAEVSMTKTKEMEDKERDERLKEKYRKMKREEFVNSFVAPPCRCAHIKSVGNGL